MLISSAPELAWHDMVGHAQERGQPLVFRPLKALPLSHVARDLPRSDQTWRGKRHSETLKEKKKKKVIK